MNSSPISSPAKPQLRDLLNQHKQEIFGDFNCHQLGTLVSFDAAKQTASVQIQTLAVLPDGSQVTYPLLTDCPVFVYSGGGAVITLPFAAGDPCLVLFHDRNFDNWFTTGNVVAPNDSRAHSLSDGLVLPGFRNLSNPIASYSTTDVVIQLGSASVSIKGNNTLVFTNGAGAFTVQADGSMYFTSGAGHFFTVTASGKMELFAASTSLGAAMDQLCAALLSWVNTGGSTPNPTTVAAITAAQAKIDSLLL